MRRFLSKLLVFLLLALLILLWAFPDMFGIDSSVTRSSSGDKIVVRDGDTMTVGDGDVRLHGIDAPEFSQVCKDEKEADWACGKLARAELLGLVKGQEISCEERARDKYKRVVATCRDGDGRDLARAMVERGMAVSFGGFAEGPYAEDEANAKADKRGLWRGSFAPPSSWRAVNPRNAPPKQ